MSAQHPSELEAVVSAVADSYGTGRLIDSLGKQIVYSRAEVLDYQ